MIDLKDIITALSFTSHWLSLTVDISKWFRDMFAVSRLLIQKHSVKINAYRDY